MIYAKALLALRRGARPFAVSGSWENSIEGWSLANLFRSTVASGDEFRPRSGRGFIRHSGDLNGREEHMDYRLSREAASRLSVSCSVWARSVEGARVRILASIDEGATFRELLNAPNVGATYQRLVASLPVEDTGVIFRITMATTRGEFDDWSITGARA